MLHSRFAIALILAALPAAGYADLIHYLPFDDGNAATLTNYGTAGGTSTTTTYLTATPMATNAAATGLGPYAEYFPQATGSPRGGGVAVSNSSGNFTLDQAGSAMTISFWLKWDGGGNLTNGRQGLINKMNSAQNQGWSLSVMSDGKLRFNFTGTSNGSRDSGTAVTQGEWTHVAMTFVSGTANTLKFYINGSYAGISNGLAGIVMATSSDSIRLGNFVGDYYAANGSMDDVAMWNTALSAEKIAAVAHIPTLLSGYGADDMQKLFTVFDDTTGATQTSIGSLTWKRVTGLGGHAAGDVWQQTDGYYIQLDSSGAGIAATTSVPEPAAVGMLGVGAVMGLRKMRR